MGEASGRKPSESQPNRPSRSRRVPARLARDRIRGRILLYFADSELAEELRLRLRRAHHPVVPRERVDRVVQHEGCSSYRRGLVDQLDRPGSPGPVAEENTGVV